MDSSVSRSAWTAALVALLSAHCGSTAETPDAQRAADATAATDTQAATDAPSSPDVPATPDVPIATDVPVMAHVPATPDVPTATDVPVMADVPVTADVSSVTDVPTAMDVPPVTDAPTAVDARLDSGSPDAPPPPAQALLGLVRGNNGASYRIGSGVVTPGGGATWDTCDAGSELVGRDFQANGYWLCAVDALRERRFFVGNVVGGVSTFWSLQRGNLTARGAGLRDQCNAGSTLLGRSGSMTDGFWVCMDAEPSFPFAHTWEFNVDNDLAGWTTNGNRAVTVRDGRITYVDPGTDPYIVSPDNRDLDASNGRVSVGLRNGTTSTEARLFFVPADLPAGSFANERSVLAQTLPNDTGSREYVFDMSTNPAWRGTMRQIRFDPGTVSGSYEIDYLRVGPLGRARITSVEWAFNMGLEGWTTTGGVATVVNGALSLNVNVNDAGLTSPLLDAPATSAAKLRIRLQNALPEAHGEVFFSLRVAPGFVQSRSVPFAMVPGDTTQREYVAELSTHPEYTGSIQQLRIDFGSTSRGNVVIDWIGLTR